MKVLIAGSTGLIGSNALKLLLDSRQVESVAALTRRKLEPHPKLQQVVINFESLESESLPKADVALCCLGTTIKAAGSQENFRKVDHEYILSFAKAAKVAGAKKFVLISALGADADSKIFYNKVKGETERDVSSVGFESVIILQPSLLLGERSESRPAEKLAISLEPLYKHFLVGPLKIYQPVRASRVAEVMVREALCPEKKSKLLRNSEILQN